MTKSFDINGLIRPNIRELTPYRSARDNYDTGLLLDANENSMGAPFPEAKALNLNRYPSPYQEKLRGKIAEWRKVSPENVFTGVGSDEAIDLLFRIFCVPGRDRIITTPPTYGMYGVSASIHDVAVEKVPLTPSLDVRVDDILAVANERTKLLFLCSPNNPTGNTLSEDHIERLLTDFPGIVVLDEAYIDFSDRTSWTARVKEFQNLVVLQTMSKSFGLAGIRMGMAFAAEVIIRFMMKVKAPYNVNALTGRYALEAFEHLENIRQNIDAIKKERGRLKKELSRLASVQEIFPSEANFLLVRMQHAQKVYQQLAERGIIVRYRGDELHCEDGLRISVGTRDENNRLLEQLKILDT